MKIQSLFTPPHADGKPGEVLDKWLFQGFTTLGLLRMSSLEIFCSFTMKFWMFESWPPLASIMWDIRAMPPSSAWGGVDNDWIFIFGWTIPLTSLPWPHTGDQIGLDQMCHFLMCGSVVVVVVVGQLPWGCFLIFMIRIRAGDITCWPKTQYISKI